MTGGIMGNSHMSFKQLKSKRNKLLKLRDELMLADLSHLIGMKARITKSCAKWYEDTADDLGMPYDKMKMIVSRPTGIINDVEYCNEDGFTFTIMFGDLDMRLGINDIEVINE